MTESTDKSASPSGVSGVASITAEPLDLAAIHERERAATPGPWEVFADPVDPQIGDMYWVRSQTHGAITGDMAEYGLVIERTEDEGGRADAEFIADARQDVPALLAEVHRLRLTLRGLLAFYDAALGCVTLDAGEELTVDGVRVSNVVSLIEVDESVRFDAALDAAEPHAEAARALLAGDQS